MCITVVLSMVYEYRDIFRYKLMVLFGVKTVRMFYSFKTVAIASMYFVVRFFVVWLVQNFFDDIIGVTVSL